MNKLELESTGPAFGRLTALAALLTPLLLSACGGPAQQSPADTADEPTAAESPLPEAKSYAVRGEVTQLPSPDNPGHQFMVRHEAVPDMVDQDGNEMAMDVMNMPFFPSDEGLLEGLGVGDKVEMTLVVDWQQAPAMRVDAITKLPADTELVFDAPVPMDHEGMDHGDMDQGNMDHGDMDHRSESEAGETSDEHDGHEGH